MGDDALEGKSTDEVANVLYMYLIQFLDCEVDLLNVQAILATIMPFSMSCTLLNAFTVLVCGTFRARLGPSLAAKLRRRALAFVLDQEDRVSNDEFTRSLVMEVLEARAPRQENTSVLSNTSRDPRLTQELKADLKHSIMRLAVSTKQALKSLPETLVQAQALLDKAAGRELEDDPLPIPSASSMRNHLLSLGDAMDCHVRDAILEAKKAGRFIGAGIATDESPPSQPRFRGLSFQVAMLYIPSVLDVNLWENCDEPPVSVDARLMDICHASLKDGPTVTCILHKQLGRANLVPPDVTSGTGDGAGENEGTSGVHRNFEEDQPSYVRRLCLNHIGWADCKQGLEEIDMSLVQALCTYLNSAISSTWWQMQCIATHSVEDGGLGLFQEGSREFRAVFSQMPGTIIQDRPEGVMNFFTFLRGREKTLALCVAKDVVARDLGQNATGLPTR